MRRRSFAVAAGAALLSPALLQARVRAAQFEFKSAGNQPLTHPASVRAKAMWETVEQETGGRLKVTHFGGSQLGGDIALVSQLRTNAVQFLVINAGIISSVVPAADISNLAFGFKDSDEGDRAMDGPLGNYVRSEIAAKGLHPLRKFWNGGMRQITSGSRAVSVADDLHNFKIRVLESKIVLDCFKTLGASPTPVSVNEVYTALQTKLVDGQETPLAATDAGRWYEVQKYLSLTNDSWSGFWFMGNGDAWKSLPSDIQDIVERNNTKFGIMEGKDVLALDTSLVTKFSTMGMIVNKAEPTTFRKQLAPYYRDWATAFGPTQWGLLQKSISGKLG